MIPDNIGFTAPAGKEFVGWEYEGIIVQGNLVKFVYFDEILQECEKVFGIELSNRYRSRNQIRRMLRY